MKIKKYIPHLILLLAAVIWGFGFAAQDKIEGLGAITIGAVRSWIASAFLIILIIVFDKLRKNGRQLISKHGVDITAREWIGGALCGVALFLASFFQQTGITMGTDGGKAAFITSLYVVLVPIYSLFIKKRPAVNVWIAVVIAALGFYLLCVKEDMSIAPTDIYVIICALIFPIHILLIDRFSDGCDTVRLSFVQFLTCAVVQTVLAFIVEAPVSLDIIGNNILPLLFLGVFSSGVAYTCQMIGQEGVEPSAASIIMSLESVFGVLGTALVVGTVLTPREYVGCAIVLGAVILSQIEFGKGANVDEPSNNG